MTLRLASAALAFTLGAGAVQAGAILPGFWEYHAEWLGAATKAETRCIHEDEIDKFFAGPSSGHYACTYPVSRVGGGRARFVGTCVDRHARSMPVSWKGTYGPLRFDLDGVLRPQFGIVELPIAAAVHARRLSAVCPG